LFLFVDAEVVTHIHWDGQIEHTQMKQWKIQRRCEKTVSVVRQQNSALWQKKHTTVEGEDKNAATKNCEIADTARTHKSAKLL